MSHRIPLPLVLAGLLILAAGMACSLGTLLPGQGVTPTPGLTLVPTFTSEPGLAVGQATSEGPIRGVLPPGVTVLPLSTPQPPGTPAAPGERNVVITVVATIAGAAASGSNPLTAAASKTPTRIMTATPTATAGPTATPRPTPYVVVSTGAVLGRRGPDGSFELIGEAKQGQQLMILATIPDKSWWQVCCIANQPAWVAGSAVTAQGPLEVVPSLPIPSTPTATATLTPAPTRTPTPTPVSPFDIARGPEYPMTRDDGNTIIWVKVYEDASNPKPLAGYVLKVFRNGTDVSLPIQSHNRISGFDNTGPYQGSFDYNLKFEMAFGGEANWEYYLARPDGSRVSPVTKFTTMGDSYRNQVVYIAYYLAR